MSETQKQNRQKQNVSETAFSEKGETHRDGGEAYIRNARNTHVRNREAPLSRTGDRNVSASINRNAYRCSRGSGETPEKGAVTTVRVHADVRSRLEAVKSHRRETVEDAVVRLLRMYEALASVSKRYGVTAEEVLCRGLELYAAEAGRRAFTRA